MAALSSHLASRLTALRANPRASHESCGHPLWLPGVIGRTARPAELGLRSLGSRPSPKRGDPRAGVVEGQVICA